MPSGKAHRAGQTDGRLAAAALWLVVVVVATGCFAMVAHAQETGAVQVGSGAGVAEATGEATTEGAVIPQPPGEEPLMAAPAALPADDDGTRWYDGVHWVGVFGGAFAIMALIGGVYIYLTFRAGGSMRKRLAMRKVHMAAGLAAAALGLGHAIARAAQEGGLEFQVGAAGLTSGFFMLVAVTGIVRNRPPGMLANRPDVTKLAHRLVFAGLLVFLLLHAIDEYVSFSGAAM